MLQQDAGDRWKEAELAETAGSRKNYYDSFAKPVTASEKTAIARPHLGIVLDREFDPHQHVGI